MAAKKVTKKKSVAAKLRSSADSVKKRVSKANKNSKSTSESVSKAKSASTKSSVTTKKRVKKTSAAKKASVKNTTKQQSPVILKSYLSQSEMNHFRILLIDKLRQILGDVDHIEKEILKMSRQDATGDLSSMPIHMADIGSDNYEQEFTLGLMATERRIVQEISMALRRIDEGSYGMCEGTGEPIPKSRLEAFPWARYCVRYAEMIEKGQVSGFGSYSNSRGSYAPSLAEGEDYEEDEEDDEEPAGDEEVVEADPSVFDLEDDDEEEKEDVESFYN